MKLDLAFEDEVESYTKDGMLHPYYPSKLKIKIQMRQNDRLYHFECIGFKFEDLSKLSKTNIENAVTKTVLKQFYLGSYLFKMTAMEI